jgi:hypothetical protein
MRFQETLRKHEVVISTIYSLDQGAAPMAAEIDERNEYEMKIVGLQLRCGLLINILGNTPPPPPSPRAAAAAAR